MDRKMTEFRAEQIRKCIVADLDAARVKADAPLILALRNRLTALDATIKAKWPALWQKVGTP